MLPTFFRFFAQYETILNELIEIDKIDITIDLTTKSGPNKIVKNINLHVKMYINIRSVFEISR